MADRNNARFERLNESNYSTWFLYAVAMLKKKGLWDIVDGATTLPLGSPNSKAVKAFRRQQEEAASEIILSVDPSQLAHVRGTDDPVQMWVELARVHRAHGLATRLSSRRRFLFMRKSAETSMQGWISQVRGAAYELVAIDCAVSDEDVILVLTQGLPKSYNIVVTTLDATDPSLLTLDYVINRLLGAESQQNHHHARDTEDTALVARGHRNLDHITCFNCQKKGHFARDCSSPKKGDTPAGHDSTNLAVVRSTDIPLWI